MGFAWGFADRRRGRDVVSQLLQLVSEATVRRDVSVRDEKRERNRHDFSTESWCLFGRADENTCRTLHLSEQPTRRAVSYSLIVTLCGVGLNLPFRVIRKKEAKTQNKSVNRT
jgi:hypothetical protein